MQKERRNYSKVLIQEGLVTIKVFWKNMHPFFSEKRKISNKITLVDNKENNIFEANLVSDKLNKLLEKATEGLQINKNSYIIYTDSNGINSAEKAINKYRNHPRVLLIKSRVKNIPSFSFNKVSLSEIERELNLINPRKANPSNIIPPKLLKSTKTSAPRH